MSLYVYTINDSIEWDKCVKSFHSYDTYWLSGYVKGFLHHGDGEPLLFYYEDSDTRGINVVMKRDIAKDSHFRNKLECDFLYDISSPYGYGGWLIEGKVQNALFNTYSEWCKKNSIVCEFVRFHPVMKNHINCVGKYDIDELGRVVTMDISSPETIWNNLTSKNRNIIRKAKKNNVKIYHGQNPQLYSKFKSIYDKTMDKDRADKYYYFNDKFYQSILDDLPYNAQIFYAVYEEEVIAASIMLMANGKINYHLSGSVKEYSSLAPTNLILYHTALWGCENGYQTLYLGGGVGSNEDSLFKFKKAFYRKDDLNKFYIGSKIFMQDEYRNLVDMRGNVGYEKFFPLYRA